jgi:transposase
MKKSRKKYSKEFKRKAVELSNVRGDVREISEELGINPNLLHRWRREFSADPDLAFSGNGKKQQSPEEEEISRLKKQLKDAEMERDILKKAIGIFSSKDGKSTNS